MTQAEVYETGQRRGDRVKRARPPALRRAAPEDVLGGDVEQHGAFSLAAASRASSTSGSRMPCGSMAWTSVRTYSTPVPTTPCAARRRASTVSEVGPAAAVRAPRHPHPRVHRALGRLGRCGSRAFAPPAASRFSRARCADPAVGVRDLEGQPPALAHPGARPRIGQGDSGVPQRRRDSCRKARR